MVGIVDMTFLSRLHSWICDIRFGMCMLGKHAVNSLLEFCWLVRDLSFTACCIPNLSYGSISFSMGMKILAWYAKPMI